MPRSDQGSIRRATERDVARHAEQFGLSLAPDELEDYRELVNGLLESFDAVLEHPEPRFPHQRRTYPERPSGRRPTAEEDPLNAWILRFRVEGAADGPLSGYEVGLKDTISFGGYPMTAGSDLLSGYTATLDATVARRLLGAGATIVGKQNMESFAFSGSGDTSDFGPVFNPYSDGHLAGGSSSGSAAAVARGDSDVSIGGDQAGSIRIPSACCGTVGLKPTTGLVPYTGALPLDLGVDHLGPIAADVERVAATLEVIAGEDVVDGVRLDPRQPRGVVADDYTASLEAGIDDLAIGVLEDGFTWEFADAGVVGAVRDAIGVLADEGARTASTSMDRHEVLSAAAAVTSTLGGARTIEDAAVCRGSEGWYWSAFSDVLSAMLDARPDQLPPSVKQAILAAAHVRETRGSSIYGVAKNIALDAERRYDRLLDTFDALALPTIVVPPMRYAPDMDRVESTGREWALAANTAAMDLTGHPAISVPCAMVDGLPVGLMLVGRHLDEATLLRIAAGFERAVDWESR